VVWEQTHERQRYASPQKNALEVITCAAGVAADFVAEKRSPYRSLRSDAAICLL
jgi:hypothetical protein